MATSLLATKLRIPPQPHPLVRRPRLEDILERGVPTHKLTWLAAPAGYGKTTLLAQWAHASRLPVAWLSLDAEDNDLERFLRYLLAAWEEAQPEIREGPLGLLLDGMPPESEVVLSTVINVAADLPAPVVFVLDDAHLLQEPTIHEALTFLLDHLPPTLHVVMAGRSEPPLPLSRYRARRELLELRVADLQFRPDETAAFLNHLLGLDLPHDDLVHLHAELEGWIAGLQLVSLTHRRNPEKAAKLAASGRHRFIADYLRDDVLAHLSDARRGFLLQTSILEQLCGPLCDAVTGRTDGQAVLEGLERENLFVVPLDDTRTWFRYHRLFADCLHQELTRQHAAELPRLHRRAARWYLAQDLPEQALAHAIAGDDAELGLEIGERYFELKLLGGELRLLMRWLESLPQRWYADYPEFGLYRAAVFLFSGAVETGVRAVEEVERDLVLAEHQDMRRQLARVTAVRCAIACFQNDLAQAEIYAGRALQELPEEDGFRAAIHHALGDTYRRNGLWANARDSYLHVLDLAQAPAFRIRSGHVFGALADLALRRGRLRESAGYWRKALAAIKERTLRGNFPLPLIGWMYIRLGEILYEWNERTEAGDHLAQGLARAELGGDVRAVLAGHLLDARLQLTAGDTTAAGESLERARPLIENAPFPGWAHRFERLQLECWLAQDRLRAAVQWADAAAQRDAHEGGPEQDTAALSLARVLVVKGDGPAVEQALALLVQVRHAAEAEGRMGDAIEAEALQALAQWRRGEQAEAMTSLTRALQWAEPEGYVRLFADLGLPMVRLLQEAQTRAVMPAYVERLLKACGAGRTSPTPDGGALPEPLSPREEEVLGLLAAGLTNREIAEQLVISAETVKKHVGNIRDKLGVRNRTQAVARARELNLLD